MKPFLLVFFAFWPILLIGQPLSAEPPSAVPATSDISFSNQNELLNQGNFQSILITGVADMNGDGLDDIIRLEDGITLEVEYQQLGQEFSNLYYGDLAENPQWCLAAADFDGNGINDLLVGGDGDEVKILRANQDGSSYNQSVLPNSAFKVQGANFADINQDGHLDIFVCNDLGYNRIWGNDGNGNFFEANTWVDMMNEPPLDAAGNYSSLWCDFDNDGDLDLHIAKCFASAMSETDPQRINELFVNDGNNNYTEAAGLYGLENGLQSWTADFQDIDNDGDLDALIINHYALSQLFENDGTGHYTDITSSSGVIIDSDPLQGTMRDFDNDGFVDILVAGNQGYQFFQNNGNGTFQEISDIFGSYNMGTFATGDLNHDGFQDVYSASPILSSNDILWMNSRNDYHFFAVNLEGTGGNLNAVGARLELHGDWGVQIREVRAGESYGIMNSFTQFFGLGNHSLI